MTEAEQLFEQVYRTYGPSLYRFCLIQMKNPADAEDILQEVFCKRLYRAPVFASPDHERRWLFRVALNQCRDAWKRSSRSELPLEAASAAVTPEELGLSGPRGRPAGVPADSPSPPLLRGLHPPGDRAAPGGDGAHGENAAEAGPGRPAEHMGGELNESLSRAQWNTARPPPELEERLREAVLSAEPEPQARTAVFRPRGFFRKALLAAVLAVVLTRVRRGGGAGGLGRHLLRPVRPGGGRRDPHGGRRPFRTVYVTSVCDDVTLTVREALVRRKEPSTWSWTTSCRTRWIRKPWR